MPCTAIVPNLTSPERAQFVYDALPSGLFPTADANARVPWRVSPEPFALNAKTLAGLEQLGPDLLAFYRAMNALYNRSVRGTAPAFIAEYLDRGKPEQIVKLTRQNRFKQDVPSLIRPDLLLTETGLVASELDSIPGGMGFVGALAEAYCKAGIESIGGADGMPRGFGEMLRYVTGAARPTVAIVVSDESGDYRGEMRWLIDAANATGTVNAFVCAPQEIVFTEDALFIRLPDGREEKLDAIYRNFELFDILNIPKTELMFYAARHNRVKMTPPPKASLEEKLAFALFHHSQLRGLWRAELGNDVFARLETVFPKTWILDSRPLPPQAVIAGLESNGNPVSDWQQLLDLGKGERDYVVKPSGFSDLAWGSKGVKIANDLTKEEWRATLEGALAAFEKTPHILQRFHKGKRIRMPYLDTNTAEIKMFDARVRLCPYYFVTGEKTTRLGGILATVAPADKRLIHGMSDAVMTSSFEKENGY
ncbi:MAG: hypothetical protein M3R51_04515 [Candidatus Eremiobacteraeota bacterium]|nr:hypothetical protein [Candidatus Eremiobacteraeota bacterium]